jgi:hypothetical protein
MSIETLTEWNYKLQMCGCCGMPGCPLPHTDYENASASLFPDGQAFIDYDNLPEGEFDWDLWVSLWVIYKNYTYSESGSSEFGSGTYTETKTLDTAFHITNCSGTISGELTTVYAGSGSYDLGSTFEVDCEGTPKAITLVNLTVWTTDAETGLASYTFTERFYTDNLFCDEGALVENETTGEGAFIFPSDYFTVTVTETFGDPVVWADFLAEIPNIVAMSYTDVGDECWTPVPPAYHAKLEVYKPYSGAGTYIQATALRVRFRIPTDHTGSKFFFTYDVGEFPDDGDPFFVSQDNTLEWTGPGTGIQTDPSWYTEWVVIPPPEAAGVRKIVNIRYTCYGAKYGVKPLVMGFDFLEIP